MKGKLLSTGDHMRARLSLPYWVPVFCILIVTQTGTVVAANKKATPPTAKDLVGIWIGFDSDQLTFTRLDLRADSTGYCARVSPARTQFCTIRVCTFTELRSGR